MLFRDPRNLVTTVFLMGLGLSMWSAYSWYRLPEWSEGEIQGSVEINLQIDLLRLPESQRRDAETLDLLRRQIRQEVEAEIAKPRDSLVRSFALGLAVMLGSLGLGVYFGLHLPPRK